MWIIKVDFIKTMFYSQECRLFYLFMFLFFLRFVPLLVDLLNLFCKYKWYFIYHYLITRKPKLGEKREDWNRLSALGAVSVDAFMCALIYERASADVSLQECVCAHVCLCGSVCAWQM